MARRRRAWGKHTPVNMGMREPSDKPTQTRTVTEEKETVSAGGGLAKNKGGLES